MELHAKHSYPGLSLIGKVILNLLPAKVTCFPPSCAIHVREGVSTEQTHQDIGSSVTELKLTSERSKYPHLCSLSAPLLLTPGEQKDFEVLVSCAHLSCCLKHETGQHTKPQIIRSVCHHCWSSSIFSMAVIMLTPQWPERSMILTLQGLA